MLRLDLVARGLERMMSRDDVRAYYDQFGEREWARLERPEDGALEFAIHCRAIAAHLPQGARVLDIGGGPGRYALWLAERGHRVVLADLSPELLAIARERVAGSAAGTLVEEIVVADACDLSRWAAGSFDAALALGPFYHLPVPADRERAAAELARVVRPGGLAFVALMPRLGFLRRTIASSAERRHLRDPEFLARLLDEGVFVNDELGRFTGGYGVRPEEIGPFFARFGFAQVALLASQSVAPDLQRELAELAANDQEAHAAALDALVRVAGEPSILGMSAHLLYAGRRVESA
jgi:SAM-dependent methyltransferase